MGIRFNSVLWTKGLFEAVKRGDLFKQFEKELGSLSGFFSTVGTLGREPGIKLVQEVARTKGQTVGRNLLRMNIFEGFRLFGETLELAPRLAIFEQAQRQGMPVSEAIFASRNATVDFAVMGTKMRLINLWIPFINARTQGMINALGAVKNNPRGSAEVLGYTVVLPAVATYLWNTKRFPDVWKEISAFEKDKNFILIYGDNRDDETGKFTQVMKLPKGEVGRIFGNPFEVALEYINEKDPAALDGLALELLSDISPVEFETKGKLDPFRAAGEITPPFVEAAFLGMGAFERNPFTGRRVVPRFLQDLDPAEQAKETTSITARRAAKTPLGEAMDLSPVRIEEMVRTGAGAAGRNMLDLLDRLQGQKKAGRVPFLSDVVRPFHGAFGGAEEARKFDLLNEMSTKSRTKMYLERKGIDDLLTRAFKGDKRSQQRFRDIINDKKSLELIEDNLKDRARGLTPFERSLKNAPVEARADFVLQEIQGLAPNEVMPYLLELQEKRILTESVVMMLVGKAVDLARQREKQRGTRQGIMKGR
jgi:hypothetical protein